MAQKGGITAYDSIVIEKQIEEVKNIFEKYDNFFYTENPKQTLENMLTESRDIFNWIEDYIN